MAIVRPFIFSIRLGHDGGISVSEETGWGGFAGLRIPHFRLVSNEDNLFPFEFVGIVVVLTAVFQDLVLHLSKNGGPTVIVLLRPPIERVIVALRALQARAEKYLSGGFGARGRIAISAIVIGRWIEVGAAPGRNQLTNE